jgi:hypothetical protein
MMNERVATRQNRKAENSGLVPGGVLRRECACGQRAAGGQCEDCRKKNLVLQRVVATAYGPNCDSVGGNKRARDIDLEPMIELQPSDLEPLDLLNGVSQTTNMRCAGNVSSRQLQDLSRVSVTKSMRTGTGSVEHISWQHRGRRRASASSTEGTLHVSPLQLEGELLEEAGSVSRVRADPNVYDINYVPLVTVRMSQQHYRYHFNVSALNTEQYCQEIMTLGCLAQRIGTRLYGLRVRRVPQQSGASVIDSPIGVYVTAFPALFDVYVPTQYLNNVATVNEELWHLFEAYLTLQQFKTYLARAIRRRLFENRRQAAQHPDRQEELIGNRVITEIVEQEMERARRTFLDQGSSILSERQNSIDILGASGRLSRITESYIQGFWPEFHMPPLTPGTTGSFTSSST